MPARLPTRIDLGALFAAPTDDEVEAVWQSFPKRFAADDFRLLGVPLVRDGVAAQYLEYRSEGLRI